MSATPEGPTGTYNYAIHDKSQKAHCSPSPHMLPKQYEMDGIIQSIYEAIETEIHLNSTLFVVTGDHGMNRQGNHGGSSISEMSAGLLFLSPRFKSITNGQQSPAAAGEGGFDFYSVVDQADLVPTLAGLLGFPIPRNSLGVFIPELLMLWDEHRDHLSLILENGFQLMKAHFSQSWGTRTDCNESPTDISSSSWCLWNRLKGQLAHPHVDSVTEGDIADVHQVRRQRAFRLYFKRELTIYSL